MTQCKLYDKSSSVVFALRAFFPVLLPMRQLPNRAALRDVLGLRTGPAGRASDGDGRVVREKEEQRDSGCLTEVKR